MLLIDENILENINPISRHTIVKNSKILTPEEIDCAYCFYVNANAKECVYNITPSYTNCRKKQKSLIQKLKGFDDKCENQQK